MKEIKLKYALGIFLILVHLVILSSVIILHVMGGYSLDEFTTLLGIVAPMFIGYTFSVGSFLIKDRYRLRMESKRITSAYAFFNFLIPFLFSSVVIMAIWMKAYNTAFKDFESFKSFILIVEGVFAAIIGLFIYSLFKRVDTNPTSSEN